MITDQLLTERVKNLENQNELLLTGLTLLLKGEMGAKLCAEWIKKITEIRKQNEEKTNARSNA